MITLDNSKERAKIKSLFEEGDIKWNTGTTLEQKREGLTVLLKGLKLLKNLYESRENDKFMIETLTKLYNERFADVDKKFKYLEERQKKADEVESNGGGAAMMKGGGGGAANDEDKKFQNALSEAIVSEKPNVKWSDVAGLENAKKALQEAVILPIKFPEIFKGARKPWKGILLYGPPGTGKTFLAKACATEADGTFFSISSSDLVSKYVGESEKLIRTLFKMAREKRPSIIFIDEIDSLCGSRSDGENDATRRVKCEFLVQMQGVGKDDEGILVLGATNIPWGLDPAIRRRFERRIYIPLPDYEGRLFLVKHNLKNTPNTIAEKDVEVIAQKIDGFSGSDVSIFVRDAVFEPVRKMQNANYFQEVTVDGKKRLKPVGDEMAGKPGVKKMKLVDVIPNELLIPEVTMEDVNRSLTRAKPSVAPDQLKNYEDFTASFGQDG